MKRKEKRTICFKSVFFIIIRENKIAYFESSSNTFQKLIKIYTRILTLAGTHAHMPCINIVIFIADGWTLLAIWPFVRSFAYLFLSYLKNRFQIDAFVNANCTTAISFFISKKATIWPQTNCMCVFVISYIISKYIWIFPLIELLLLLLFDWDIVVNLFVICWGFGIVPHIRIAFIPR